MALPTKSDAETMDYSQDGSPWVFVASKAGLVPGSMDYSQNGSPWYGVEEISGSSGIKTWDNLAIASVKTINGLVIESVKTINNLA